MVVLVGGSVMGDARHGSFTAGRGNTSYLRSQTTMRKHYRNEEEEYKRNLRSSYMHGSAMRGGPGLNPLYNRGASASKKP